MSTFFQFEAEFIDNLRCIPMQVRLNLDTCGVKLKLVHWNQLTTAERQSLVETPCSNKQQAQAYKEYLQNLIISKTGQPANELTVDDNPPWMDISEIPAATKNKATEFGVTITLQQWQNLTPLQRFALIKLSRPSHENKNFYPALKEFGII
ncbi:MAG: nitrate reductase associated protein [Calothrix sp. MO_192.B10]|nr:nitrate reductase associated protein [Calothrix sp. MO_192.B10]